MRTRLQIFSSVKKNKKKTSRFFFLILRIIPKKVVFFFATGVDAEVIEDGDDPVADKGYSDFPPCLK